MKLLVLYQARNPAQDHPGYYEGFERMVAEGQLRAHVPIGYLGVAEARGWDALWTEAHRAAREMQADAVFLQFFHAQMPNPENGILRIKNLPQRPLIFSSLGDPFGRWTHRIPQSFRVASRLSDISFLTGMGYIAQQLAGWGARNLVLMPHGCCQVRFCAPIREHSAESEFDVSFVGSRIRSMNPFGHFYWTARRRAELVAAFTKRFGKRFGLFGKGWEGNRAWQGTIPFASQLEAYRRSSVVLGGMPGAEYDYYTSDRPFIAAASGVPLVDYWVRGVDRLLEPGRDWWLAHDIKELLRLSDTLLEMPGSDRLLLAGETRKRILAHHTQYHRCLDMIQIVRNLMEARRQGRQAAEPELPFLRQSSLPGAPPAAIVGWVR
jgi:hypothetical protein